MFLNANKTFLFIFLFIGACESAGDQLSRKESEAKKTPNTTVATDGMAIFRQRCVVCHGSDGNLGLNGAKHLSESILPVEDRVHIIANGKNLMTPFGALLNPEEIRAVADYTLTLKK